MNTIIEHVLLTSGFLFAGIYFATLYCLLRGNETPIILQEKMRQ
jgi:hypothetical protein